MGDIIIPDMGDISKPRRRVRVWWVLLTAFLLVVGFAVIVFLPSFLNPLAHDRYSTALGEMRNIAVAIESFRVYEGRLPTVREFYSSGKALPNDVPAESATLEITLTSPVAHIAGVPGDPCRQRKYSYFYYTDLNNCWILGSAGPDHEPDFFLGAANDFKNERAFAYGVPGVSRACDPRFFRIPEFSRLLYDPKNGIRSKGDIIKTGP